MSQTHPTRWEALTEVARRCVAEKQFDKAEEAFLAALREAEQFGDTDPRVAATLNALARVYHRRSKFFPAAALLHRLLGIKEREHGDEHPELAGILNNLAEMYSRLGDVRQELELRERALCIRTGAGESDGGALQGLRTRIAELRQKLDEERAREEAARNAPKPRIPVPTGATDLPLILPTPVASPALSPLAPAFAPSRKAALAPAPVSKATAPAPLAPRSPTPEEVHEADSLPAAYETDSLPAAHEADSLPAVTTTPIGSNVTLAEPSAEPVVRPNPTPESSVAAPVRSPLAPPAQDSTWKPIAPPAPDSTWKPFAPPAPDTSWKPIAPSAPDFVAKRLAPPAPDSAWKRLAPPAPDSTWKPVASPAPGSAWGPLAAPAPDRRGTPLAPPAPVLSWPEESRDDERGADPQPDDYDAPLEFAPRRNLKPLAYGGLAVAALALIAAFTFGSSETADSSSGAVAPRPAAKPAPPPAFVSQPMNAGEAAALEAGLANLQQETEGLPPASQPPDRSSRGTDARRTSSDGGAGDAAGTEAPPTPRLRIAVPSASLDKVTSGIEAAARARVDSLTQVNDKQVYEYTGKKPRQ